MGLTLFPVPILGTCPLTALTPTEHERSKGGLRRQVMFDSPCMVLGRPVDACKFLFSLPFPWWTYYGFHLQTGNIGVPGLEER